MSFIESQNLVSKVSWLSRVSSVIVLVNESFTVNVSCLIRDCVGAVWWSHDGLSLLDDNTSLRIDLLLPINEVMRSNKFRETNSAHG